MQKIPIKFIKKHKDAVIPEKKTSGSACMDLVATEIIQEDEDKVTVKFGIASSIPMGFKMVLVPRSSFTNSGWVLANSPCQIDSDYRGEWQIRFDAIPSMIYNNFGDSDPELRYPEFPYKIGDRVAQCYLEKVIDCEFEEVEDLDITVRGEGGFGSTDRKLPEYNMTQEEAIEYIEHLKR